MTPPDDRRFRPDDTTGDDYDVGEGYGSAPAPGTSSPDPYDAIQDAPHASAPYGTAPQTPPPPAPQPPAAPVSSSVPPGSPGHYTNPYSWRGASRANIGQPKPGRAALVALIGIAAVAALALVGNLISGQGADEDAPVASDPTTVEDMPTVWTLELASLDIPDDADIGYHPDGAFTGPQVIAGDDAWVVSWTEGSDHTPGGLIAIDPDTGTELWHRALYDVTCADRMVDGQLLCFAQANDTWVYHRIDALTGEDRLAAETRLKQVQTVHATGETLVAIGSTEPAPHAHVSGISPDGSIAWAFDVADLDEADLLFTSVYDSDGEPVLERPRWRDLDGGLIMLWSTPGLMILDPDTGEAFIQYCRRATPVGDHYYCDSDGQLTKHELDGTQVWSAPGLFPATPEDASDSRLVALSEPTTDQFEVHAIDSETGDRLGEAIYRFQQVPGTWTSIVNPPSVNAEEDATFLVGDQVIVALDPESGDLLWSQPHDEIYVGDIMQIGDVAVQESGSQIMGRDPATGEIVWVRDGWGDLYEIDGSLVSVKLDEVSLLELPQ